MTNQEGTVGLTPGQKRTANARRAMRIKAAQRHQEQYREALELIGYTVVGPEEVSK